MVQWYGGIIIVILSASCVAHTSGSVGYGQFSLPSGVWVPSNLQYYCFHNLMTNLFVCIYLFTLLNNGFVYKIYHGPVIPG